MSEIKVNSVVNSTGDNDSGLDLSTNDQVIIKTANTTAITVDSSQGVTVAGAFTSRGIDDNADATAITIDSSENVGIGRTPDTDQYADLTVLALGNGSTIYAAKTGSPYLDIIDNAFLNSAGNFEYQTSNVSSRMELGSGNITFHNAPSGTAGNTATFTERMRIDTNGKVQISSDGVADGFLHIKQNYQTDIGMSLNDTSGSGGTAMRFKVNGSTKGEISFNTTSTTYSTSSDHRLKENVTTDWDATTRLKQLNPVRFNFIADADTTVDGFLAHEVQSVVPEAITGTHNEVDDDGNPVYQSIDQSKLVPLLVKTIQELEARIVALENAE